MLSKHHKFNDFTNNIILFSHWSIVIQSLGEMVIGAFKHAGRRRMAFRVGAMIAQFHKDLGLITEAEELLSDICKFYSEDQWIQLSTKAYSLLADCQMKLRLEDK